MIGYNYTHPLLMNDTVDFVLKYIRKNAFQYVCLSLFLLLNIIFFYKYSIRISNHPLLFSLGYGALQVLLFFGLLYFLQNKLNKRYSYLIFLFIVIIQFILLLKIDVNTLNIDRWSVITSFLDELFVGNYPYLAKSHLNNPPGPFPGYYLFALPFYLIGEIGLFSLTGIVLYLLFLKSQNFNDKLILINLILIFSSVVVWYELVVRSTIFANMAISLMYFTIIKKMSSESFINLVLIGILGGLVLSTRGIIVYVLIVYFTYFFISRKDWYSFSIVSISTALGFLLTLIPFIIWDWQIFMIYNPITLQASFIPKIYLIIFAIIAFIIGFFSKNTQRLFGYTGLLLFTIISIPFFFSVLNSSIYYAIVENGFDISYFLFSFPFLIYALFNNKKQLR